ncbi:MULTISPECIES: hypothetical protein [unclassified Shewanella]|uniref:hypothetical protein n=1 Tax=unclassified Shewanella TaxID=196818 RepID=UPI001BC1147A|nr:MULTISPECIES: hypothetical protein [unclassified Shewanella]GIU06667.1 hypothetical protein TUM4444_04880 [Shewanella sp. MBTL60-112-B1]GIU26523.1 hypothetical protein TUM4445_05780 [Shewanella sp. MBTL60-112-B2]
MKLSGVQAGLLFCLVGFSAVAWADSGDNTLIQHVDNRTTVGTKSFSNNSGRIAINQAAGGSNLQTNSHAIGERVIILSDQKNPYLPLAKGSNGQNLSYIEALAFENAQGLISVNQVSGQGNIQANLGAIALQSVIGLGLDDNALDNIASPTALPLEHQDTNLTVIAANSFENAQGIVQINQISGDGNSAINQFSLQLPSGN